jgi:hypothetical protein
VFPREFKLNRKNRVEGAGSASASGGSAQPGLEQRHLTITVADRFTLGNYASKHHILHAIQTPIKHPLSKNICGQLDGPTFYSFFLNSHSCLLYCHFSGILGELIKETRKLTVAKHSPHRIFAYCKPVMSKQYTL